MRQTKCKCGATCVSIRCCSPFHFHLVNIYNSFMIFDFFTTNHCSLQHFTFVTLFFGLPVLLNNSRAHIIIITFKNILFMIFCQYLWEFDKHMPGHRSSSHHSSNRTVGTIQRSSRAVHYVSWLARHPPRTRSPHQCHRTTGIHLETKSIRNVLL